MSNVWFTSDLHIGHTFIAQMRWDAWKLEQYPSSAHINVQDVTEWHDDTLAEKWDSTVDEDDTVWVLGDISSGTKTAQYNALQWIQDRPGIKHLIAGNHDGPFPHNRDAHKWIRLYLHTFESVAHLARRRVPLDPEGHIDALLSHIPYTDEFTGVGQAGRFMDYRPNDYGKPCIHGHTHSHRKASTSGVRRGEIRPTLVYPRTLQLHVGVDAWEGALCPLSWIVSAVQGWVCAFPSPERPEPTEPVLRVPANPDYPHNAPEYQPYNNN